MFSSSLGANPGLDLHVSLPSDLGIATAAAGPVVGVANPLLGWRTVGWRRGGGIHRVSQKSVLKSFEKKSILF